jgi:hypothetical protein
MLFLRSVGRTLLRVYLEPLVWFACFCLLAPTVAAAPTFVNLIAVLFYWIILTVGICTSVLWMKTRAYPPASLTMEPISYPIPKGYHGYDYSFGNRGIA